MNTERDNLNQLRSSVTFKKSTPLVDSGFSSNLNKQTKKIQIHVLYFSIEIINNESNFTNEYNSTII